MSLQTTTKNTLLSAAAAAAAEITLPVSGLEAAAGAAGAAETPIAEASIITGKRSRSPGPNEEDLTRAVKCFRFSMMSGEKAIATAQIVKVEQPELAQKMDAEILICENRIAKQKETLLQLAKYASIVAACKKVFGQDHFQLLKQIENDLLRKERLHAFHINGADHIVVVKTDVADNADIGDNADTFDTIQLAFNEIFAQKKDEMLEKEFSMSDFLASQMKRPSKNDEIEDEESEDDESEDESEDDIIESEDN